jgi:hypothetical protein
VAQAAAVLGFLSFVPFQILKWTRQHSRERILVQRGAVNESERMLDALLCVRMKADGVYRNASGDSILNATCPDSPRIGDSLTV